MTTLHAQAFTVGKYLLTPLSRIADSGRFTASLSVRSGQGRGTHDRIYTFMPEFATRENALIHASAQARAWLCQAPALA
jgi:hypothetical protein